MEDINEIDLSKLFNMIWSKKVQIIIITCITLIIGYIYTIYFTTPIYSSSVTLVLASSSRDENTTITSSDVTINSKLISTYRILIKSKNVLNDVISNLNLEMSETELNNSVTVSSVTNTELIKITVNNSEPEMASKIANEIGNVFSVKVKELYNIDNVQIMSQANIPSAPSNINHLKDILMFFAVGIVLSGIYVFVCNILDITLKSAEEIEKEYGVTVLASIPTYSNKIKTVKGGKK